MQPQRIVAIDDQAAGRTTMRNWIHNHYDVDPIEFSGARPVTSESLKAWALDNKIDAVLVDYQLRTGGYSRELGLAIAANLCDAGIPAVLTSSYERASMRSYIWYVRRAPAFVPKGRMQDLPEAMEVAVRRAKGIETRETKPYRTLVRVDSVDDDDVGLVIPAYSTSRYLMVSKKELLARISIDVSPNARFMADVNIGARTLDDVFLDDLQQA